MEVEGRIKKIGETQSFGSNGFRKRELVVTIEDQYPQDILIEFVQDKVELLDGFSAGDLVKVPFNLRGREWTNPQGEVKYFNSVQGWRISKVSSDSGEPKAEAKAKPELNYASKGEADDLPF